MRVAEECGGCDINLGILTRTWGEKIGSAATTVGSTPGVISGQFERVTRSISARGTKAKVAETFVFFIYIQRAEQLVAEHQHMQWVLKY